MGHVYFRCVADTLEIGISTVPSLITEFYSSVCVHFRNAVSLPNSREELFEICLDFKYFRASVLCLCDRWLSRAVDIMPSRPVFRL